MEQREQAHAEAPEALGLGRASMGEILMADNAPEEQEKRGATQIRSPAVTPAKHPRINPHGAEQTLRSDPSANGTKNKKTTSP